MEFCLICGKEYDPIADAFHQENCEERLTEQVQIKYRTVPELKQILEGLLGREKTK